MPPPSSKEIHSVMRVHLRRLHDYYGETHGVRVARKHIGWYLKGRPDAKQILYDLVRVPTAKEQFQLLERLFLNQPEMAA